MHNQRQSHHLYRHISCLRLLLSLGVGIILFTACQTRPSAGERLKQIVASSPDCVAPCWNGLIPGHSTVADLEAENVKHTSLHPIGERYSWNITRGGDRIFADVHDGVIRAIGFHLGEDFTPGVIWAELGEPDNYEAYIGIGGEISVSFFLRLFYITKGIVFNLYIAPFEKQLSEIQVTCQVTLADIQNAQAVSMELYFTVPGTAQDMVYSLHTATRYEVYEWRGANAFDLAYCGRHSP